MNQQPVIPEAIRAIESYWLSLNGGLPPSVHGFDRRNIDGQNDQLILTSVESASARVRYHFTGTRIDAWNGRSIVDRYLDDLGFPDHFGSISHLISSYKKSIVQGTRCVDTYLTPGRRGEVFTTWFGIFPFQRDGIVTEIVGIEDFSAIPREISEVFSMREFDDVAARNTVSNLNIGLAWISPKGELFHTNSELRSMFERGDGIGCKEQFIDLAPALTVPFRKALTTAFEHGSSVMTIPRRGGSFYKVEIRRAPQDEMALSELLMSVFESTDLMSLAVSNLSAVYSLTKAESQVLGLIAKGSAPAGAARQMGSSIHTIRTQIKSILSKAGVTRQINLIRMLAVMQ